jgi:hypothetical protein
VGHVVEYIEAPALIRFIVDTGTFQNIKGMKKSNISGNIPKEALRNLRV